jgi:uncharacterized repeat protein (TIGR01451 family)
MPSFALRRTSLLFPIVLVALAACQDSTAPRPLSRAKVHFAQGDNNTWTVNTLDDPLPAAETCDETVCTLRGALWVAAAGGNIVFASGLQGTINLNAGNLGISQDLTVDGDGRITLDAKGLARVLRVSGISGKPTVKLSNLKLTGGATQNAGGGIVVSDASLVLDHVTVTGNRADDSSGGGIILIRSDATIVSSSVSGNIVASSGTAIPRGGGIFVDDDSELNLVNSTVDGNQSPNGSGGGIANHGKTTIIASTVSNNSAQFAGGGILSDQASATIIGSTFSGNSAAQGGGIFNSLASTDVRSSTVTGNKAPEGAGINAVFTLRVANSLIAGNSGLNECRGAVVSDGHNLGATNGDCNFTAAGDVVVQLSQVFTEVLESALKDNGGPTKTHALIARGRAVDKGYCPGESTDQRGFTRPIDDPVMPNALDACDIGAYEIQGPVAAVADLMISQSVDKPSAKQGDKVTYTIRVQNLGPQTAPNVEVNDILSSGVTFVEAKANKGSLKAPPKGENGTVTWTLGDMLNGANETATISVTVIIKGKTTITNVASVTGAVADPNSANNSSSIAVSVGSGGTIKGAPKP